MSTENLNNEARIGLSSLNAGLAADSKRALELLGSIFYCGNFVAETRNEQELETLMRKHGYFIETADQFDTYCRKVHYIEQAHVHPELTMLTTIADAVNSAKSNANEILQEIRSGLSDLAVELAVIKRDADRYRWLRDSRWIASGCTTSHDDPKYLRTEKLDGLIDSILDG